MLTPSQRNEKQCSSSHVLFDVLSPHREKARFESMKETIHSLKTKAEYFFPIKSVSYQLLTSTIVKLAS